MIKASFELPAHLKPVMRRATMLEWITVAYLASVIALMYLVLGSSQAMKAAWLEDALSMIPAISFLVASRFFQKSAKDEFPYGYQRAYTVAFLVGAVALTAMGAYLFVDSMMALFKKEHPTIGSIVLFGRQIWLGWLMIAALAYSFLPAIVIGRLKQPLALRLHNKILYTDANAQKADYTTAGAAMIGILGIGFGWWWADAAAAVIISLSILRDGIKHLVTAVGDVMDRQPKTVEDEEDPPILKQIRKTVEEADWVERMEMRIRENGMLYFGEILVVPCNEQQLTKRIGELHDALRKLDWKVQDIMIMPLKALPK